MNDTPSTEQQLNTISEFRQALYRLAFTARRDALFEVLDALLLRAPVASFPLLSLSLFTQRQWPSFYAAVEDGQMDTTWLSSFLARQVPSQGVQVLSLDSTAWPRPQSCSLPDRQYVYHPTGAVNGKPVVIGYPYSLLDWVPFRNQSWSLSVDVARVPSTQTAVERGVEQVRGLAQARQNCHEALDIIAADAKYGNHKFFGLLQGQRCGLVAALRRDQVLYRQPSPEEQPTRGRKKKHGRRFAFKDPDTWGEPDEVMALEDERWGKVELRRWHNLHEKSAADVPLDVVQARVHLEREKPPPSFWLAWQAPPVIPAPIQITAQLIWTAYQYRWPIEPGIRFRKQNLMWTVPRFQTPETGDRWAVLVSLAMWILFLGREVVTDRPLPWERAQSQRTPGRVQRGMGELFCKIGSPVRPVKTRGNAPGWPQGKVRQRQPRHAVVKKVPSKAQQTAKAA